MGGVGFDFLRYDAMPALRQIRQPILAFYGTMDPSIPFVESTEALTTALRQAGNEQYTIRYMDEGDHAMRIGGGDFTRGYLQTLANWIRGLPGTAVPAVHLAGATPVQRFEASDVPAAPWYAGGTMLGLTICLAAVGYVAGPVAAMVVRLRGRRHTPAETNARLWPPIRRRLRRMVWTGLGLLASVVAFITLLVLFSVNQAGAWPAVLAGWLVVRVLAVLMLVQEVTAVAAVVAGLREGMRPGRWQHVAIAGVLGGTGLLLVAAAYYGLFSFPWWTYAFIQRSISVKTCLRTGSADSTRSCRPSVIRTQVTCGPTRVAQWAICPGSSTTSAERASGTKSCTRNPLSEASTSTGTSTARPACSRRCARRIAASQVACTENPPSGLSSRS
jgi:hypothetical protein